MSSFNSLNLLTETCFNMYWKTRARVTPRAAEALTPDNFYN